MGVGGRNPGLQRLALPCAVLIVGTRLDWSDAARYLGSVIGAHSAGQEIARFATGPHWPALQVALIRLSDYLADHRTAINYRRRRCLDYTGLLPDGQWGQICRHVESDAAGCVPAGLARLVLFEKITAMPARFAPFASGPRPSQATIDNAALLLTPGQVDGMNGAASEFLNSHKIREPVTWHPPVRLLNGLDLPGRDPRSINRDVLVALAAPRDLSAHQLAHRLGTDAATVRHLLDAHPAPTLSYAARVRRRSAPVMDATRSTLTPEQFVELYVNQALSLNEIAHRLGVSRKTIAGFAHAEGIRLRPPGTPSRISSVDAAWLYEQYVTRRRTLPEIGRMIGMTPVSVAHWARQFGIPLRPRGSASHAAVLHPTDVSPSVLASVPPILRPVAQRVTGLRDLQWFADASTYPTLGQAARELRMGAATLVTAVGRLERELGGRLLIRAERGRPMRLTPLGAEVAAAVNACRA